MDCLNEHTVYMRVFKLTPRAQVSYRCTDFNLPCTISMLP